jgi:SAM-dependent methyltransferase
MSKYGAYESDPTVAVTYDLVPQYAQRADLDFYLEQVQSVDGSVLELGCGTGRILLPVARAGASVTGLDISAYMLDRCRSKLEQDSSEVQERVTLVQANMAGFELDQKFDLAISVFRAIQHVVDVDEQLALFQSVRRHLKPGGRLVFDVFQPNWDYLVNPPSDNEVEDVAEFELPDGRRLRRTHRMLKVHRSDQCSEVELIYYITDADGHTERTVQAFPMRFFFRWEMEHLLARCGFEVKQIYGNFDKSPLEDKSPEMIFVAEVAA